MKLRFYNAKILTMRDEKVIEGELHTDNGAISHIGEPKKGEFDREIDLGGSLIIPGFKNAHTHTAMTFLRSFADDLPLNDWLYEQVFPHEAKLTEEAVYVFTQLGNMEYLTSGITASFDMYMKLPAYVKACKDMGFRTVLCGSINDFGGTVEGIEEEYNTYNSYDPLISYQLGFTRNTPQSVRYLRVWQSCLVNTKLRCTLTTARPKPKSRAAKSVTE